MNHRQYMIKILILIFILLFVSLLFFITYKKYNQQYQQQLIEYMSANSNIVLLGDSILNNAIYVKNINHTVYGYIKSKHKNTYQYAKDNSTITDLYNQVDNIPNDIINENTNIFISIGGNDILQMSMDSETEIDTDEKEIKTKMNNLFKKYMKFLSLLKTTFPLLKKIYLLNLYYPPNFIYHKYYPYIEIWNQILEDNQIKMEYNIIETSNLMTNITDFAYDIEPSDTGSKKISYKILETV